MNSNPLNTELHPICHLLELLGAHHIFQVSGLRVKGPSFIYLFLVYSATLYVYSQALYAKTVL